MSEPIYIRQTGEPKTPNEKEDWVLSAVADARAQGAVFFRLSWLECDFPLMLLEGWSEQPDNCGYPRWMFAGEMT
jgi:hypothetical protein